MYYEEKIIGGVLSFRNTPDGEWVPLSAKELTERLQKCKEKHVPENQSAKDMLVDTMGGKWLTENSFQTIGKLTFAMSQYAHMVIDEVVNNCMSRDSLEPYMYVQDQGDTGLTLNEKAINELKQRV